MKKTKVKELLPLYVTGDLSQDIRDEIAAEIEESAELCREVERLTRLIGRISTDSSESVADEALDDLGVNTLKYPPICRNRPQVLKSVISFTAVVAMVCILMLFFIFSPGRIQKAEEWLVNNLYSTEASNGDTDVSVDSLDETELLVLGESLTTKIVEIAGAEDPEEIFSDFSSYWDDLFWLNDDFIQELYPFEDWMENGGI